MTPSETVESYYPLARRMRDEGQQHPWQTHDSLICADVRARLGMKPPAIEIGGKRFEALEADR